MQKLLEKRIFQKLLKIICLILEIHNPKPQTATGIKFSPDSNLIWIGKRVLWERKTFFPQEIIEEIIK